MYILVRSWTSTNIKALILSEMISHEMQMLSNKRRTTRFAKTKQEIFLAVVKLISVYELKEYAWCTLIKFSASLNENGL